MPVRRLLFFLALALACRPAAAQTGEDYSGVTPDGVLGQAWTEALYGAEAVAFALDDVADDTTGAAPETAGAAGRARATAAVASAATAATVVLSMQFSIALAGPADRPSVAAALEEDVVSLHTLLVLVAETVDPPPTDPTLMTAQVQNADGTPAADVAAEPEDWAVRAAQIRTVVGRLRGATAALGITAP